jgi:hypothetical protein
MCFQIPRREVAFAICADFVKLRDLSTQMGKKDRDLNSIWAIISMLGH